MTKGRLSCSCSLYFNVIVLFLTHIRELARRGEQVGYLTKRERIALIRAILASDEADDIAFLTGIENGRVVL